MIPTIQQSFQCIKLSRNFSEAAALVTDAPVPSPSAGEVLLKNVYAAINASDVNLAAGAYFSKDFPLPFPLGFDSIATVVAHGGGVTAPALGAPVLCLGAGGAFAEYRVAPAAQLIPLPAASREFLPTITSGATAAIGLFSVGEARKGETVLITAAAGAVGCFAVQLAKRHGCRVVGVVSTREKAETITRLGADAAIVSTEEDLDRAIGERCPDGVDVAFENVGGETFDICLKHLRRRGRLVECGHISEYRRAEMEKVTRPRIYGDLLWRSLSIRAFLISDYAEAMPGYIGDIMNAIVSGEIKAEIDPRRFHGVASVPDAVEYMYSRKNTGKIVVDIAP